MKPLKTLGKASVKHLAKHSQPLPNTKLKLKPLRWSITNNIATARIMGVLLSVYPNNGKYDCRLSNGNDRPETETGFFSLGEAMEYAESELLERELARYFILSTPP